MLRILEGMRKYSSKTFSNEIWKRIAHNIKEKPYSHGSYKPKSENTSQDYMEKVETKTSGPQASLGLLENELKEEVAAALGRTGSKLNIYLSELKDLEANKNIERYKKVWKLAEKAKWELMIHRQAVGFRFKNRETIEKLYPFPPKYPDSFK